MANLRYLDDAGNPQIKSLDMEQFLIGRAASCNIVFDDDMISREHVRIDMEADGRYRIKDLGSRNKTYINGQLSPETLLSPGDIVRVGDRVLEFIDDSRKPGKFDLEVLTPDQTEPPDTEWVKMKAPVSLTVAQLEQLSRLWGDQPLTARAEDVAESALSALLIQLQAERGFIALRGDKKTDVRPLAHRGLARPAGGSLTPVSQSFAMAPMLQSVAGRYPRAASKLNPKLGYAVTAMVAPLVFRGELVGTVYVDRPVAKRPFTAAALQQIFAAGALVGSMLGETSRSLARSAAREGIAWMSTLRRVQTSLSTAPASSDGFDVSHYFSPGRVRCGDVWDVVHLDEQRCCAVVIDGGGHGITGLVQANMIRASVRAAVAVSEDSLLDPSALLNEINQQIASSATRQVLPCTYVGIDLAAGKLIYVNAGGMPPLLMVAAGRLVTLDQPSLILGVDGDYVYEATRADLPEVFRLICYTDGLKEAASSAGEALGDQRLHETLLDRKAFAKAAEVSARIEGMWINHMAGSQSDDDALALVISRG